jgi:hypothetical protein
MTEAFAAADPIPLALDWLIRAVSPSCDTARPDVTRMTRYDLDQVWRAVPANSTDPTGAAAYLLLAAAIGNGVFDPARFASALAERGRHDLGDAVWLLTGIGRLYPDNCRPSLVLVSSEADDAGRWSEQAIRLLERIAIALPALPVGVCVSNSAYAAASAVFGNTRTAALVREGAIPLPVVSAEELAEQLRAAGVAPPPPAATLDRLLVGGLSPDVATAFVDAARTVRTADAADIASDFRSVHEQFLFEQLESLPETAGLFRPNRALAFRHGSQPAEADLVAERLKIVVEVDGGYYHLNTTQYRRDRRKDWLYQRHGYLVLRFLAEDVVDDLEAILTTILDAVALRQSEVIRAQEPSGE